MNKQWWLEIQTVDPLQTEIISLLEDCARMTREFYPAISVACLQIHHHVLPFLPLGSRFSQVYGPRALAGVVVREGRERGWSACVRVLEGHTDGCTAVAFSPDGGRLVSGSEDGTLRLGNVQPGADLQVVKGHEYAISCATYSPDGMRIASGSHYRTVRI